MIKETVLDSIDNWKIEKTIEIQTAMINMIKLNKS